MGRYHPALIGIRTAFAKRLVSDGAGCLYLNEGFLLRCVCGALCAKDVRTWPIYWGHQHDSGAHIPDAAMSR